MISLVNCTSALKEETEAEKLKVKKVLFDFYARDYPIIVFPFTNQSRGTNFAYLEEAIPETIGIVLQSLERDYIPIDGMEYVRLQGFPFILEEKILSAKISSWESYKMLSPQVVTQVQRRIETNNRFIQTNTFTNIKVTNVFRFATNKYEDFLMKEFPDLVKEISFLSFSWRVEKSKPLQTNVVLLAGAQSTNSGRVEWTYEGHVYGRFSVRENRIGPSEVDVTIVLLKIKGYTTNRLELLVRTTEDRVYEEILRRRGDIRRFYLEGALVDVEVTSEPEDANVYLNNVYIGRTPLIYEAVRVGSHQLQFVKEGFETINYRVNIQEGGTNFVKGILQKRDMTGVITLYGESNRLVFLNSLYMGVTPLVISNVSLFESHVLLIRTDNKNYEDVYYEVTLTKEKPYQEFMVGKGKAVARRQWEKNLRWGICYGGWGVTIGFIGAHFYISALKRYYEDQLYAPVLTMEQRQAYASQVSLYTELQQRMFTYGILSSLVSMGLTAYALSQEEVYLAYEAFSERWVLGYTIHF